MVPRGICFLRLRRSALPSPSAVGSCSQARLSELLLNISRSLANNRHLQATRSQSAASSSEVRSRRRCSACRSRSSANLRSSFAMSGARSARSRRDSAASWRNAVRSFCMVPVKHGAPEFSFVLSCCSAASRALFFRFCSFVKFCCQRQQTASDRGIVRRQGFRDNGLSKLREALAHRVGDVRRPAAGAASGG